jgi:hypothetical protein
LEIDPQEDLMVKIEQGVLEIDLLENLMAKTGKETLEINTQGDMMEKMEQEDLEDLKQMIDLPEEISKEKENLAMKDL